MNGASKAIDSVLEAAAALVEVLDAVIDAHDEATDAVRAADWAFYRFATSRVAVRDRSGGIVPATLARGLLEEAAYWDWALASGVGSEWRERLAAIEYQRLASTADNDDQIWLRWILPPGVSVLNSGAGVPNQADVVRRLGQGLDERLLEPLRIHGLFGAYKLIEVLTHCGPATALLLRSADGPEMPQALSAASLHVGGAAAAAIVDCHLDLEASEREALWKATSALALAGEKVHFLSAGASSVLRPAKARRAAAFTREADIDWMPPADPATQAAAAAFVSSAHEFTAAAGLLGPHEADAFGCLGAATLALASSHLMVLKGVIDGTLGRALLPMAARALFEDGARWGWVHESVAVRQDGSSARALIGDARRYLTDARDRMIGEGIPRKAVDSLLREARAVLDAPVDGFVLPPLAEMLAVAYPPRSGRTESASPIYSILSQFVHSTPIAALHLKRDVFHSLSAPTYAVAVEAACRGYCVVATATRAVVFGSRSEALLPYLEQMWATLGSVCDATSVAHFLD